jgi:hypothetical protein
MKKLALFSAILVSAAVASQAQAGGVNLHLGFNLPLPPLPGLVVTHPAPVYAPAPVVTTAAPCQPAAPVYESSVTCEQPVVTTAPLCAPAPAPFVVAPAPVCPPQVVVAPRPVIVERSRHDRGQDWNNRQFAYNAHENRNWRHDRDGYRR